MGIIEEILGRNRAAAEASPPPTPGRPSPTLRVAVVACMDARLLVSAALGLGPGDAHIMRNAGGVVTDDVIRSLAISQLRLGTREIMVIQHTDCGLHAADETAVREQMRAVAGQDPPFAIGAFADLDASVRASLARVRSSPFIPHTDAVHGFVYDVETGLLREVDEG